MISVYMNFTFFVKSLRESYISNDSVYTNMESAKGRVQDAVKAACSLSYVSEKLGISRPTLYKYMDLYDSGQSDRLPTGVRRFFAYVTAERRTEEDVILYFMRGDREGPPMRVRTVSDGGRAMVIFPDADPDEAVVKVFADFDGISEEIAEYRPEPGRRFVTIDDLVPGATFYLEVQSGDMTSGMLPLEIQRRGSAGGEGVVISMSWLPPAAPCRYSSVVSPPMWVRVRPDGCLVRRCVPLFGRMGSCRPAPCGHGRLSRY